MIKKVFRIERLFLAVSLCFFWTGAGFCHGDISKLPTSVQIMQYRLSIYINPEDLEARNGLAMALYRTNELVEAEKELREVLERDPMDFDALDGLGIVLMKRGDYAQALESLKKAVKVNEQDVMVHVHLSALYEKMKLPEEAKAALHKARFLAPDEMELENIEKELELVGGR
jgi:Flp pilus assembly protein TadD